MIRVTYVLGVLLVLVGVASVAYGLPDVRVETGWTAVISGTVAASAGCVILVLGALLARLDTLLAVVAGASPAVAAAGPAEPAVERQRETPAVVDVEPAAEREVEDAPAAPPVPGPAAAVFAAGPQPAIPLDVERPAVPVQPFTLQPVEAVTVPARKRPNFLASFLSRRAAQREEDLSRLFGPAAAPGPLARDPDDRGHEASAAPEIRHEAADTAHEAGSLDGDPLRPTYAEDFGPDHAVAEHAEAEGAEPGVADPEPAQPAQPVLDHPLRPSVVGRYTAGSASYIMYSNGMIEVETEQGTHQFGSMQELKAFIENQDPARV